MSQDKDINNLVSLAVEHLRKGELIGLPTETVYGLAGAIDKNQAIKQIFAIKERPFFDPLIVHVASIAQAKSLVTNWPPAAEALAHSFWPGPLTMVLPRASSIDPLICSGLNTIAIRMPNHPLALAVIEKMGTPIAAPSANKFGKTSPSRAEDVRKAFPHLFVLDGGLAQIGIESTVASVTDSQISILRPGIITEHEITKELHRHGINIPVVKSESSASPGHLKHHYMPEMPLVLIDQISAQRPKWNFVQEQICMRLKISPVSLGRELLLSKDPLLAARELYVNMRELGDAKPDFIYIWREPENRGGIWDAIWDRVEKASSVQLKF